MKLKNLKDKSILILGLGREGLSALKFLNKEFPSETSLKINTFTPPQK